MKTLNELFNYIDSLGKSRGYYTYDELLDIGLKHKNLAQKERNWNKLSEYVGYKGSPDSYRKFVYVRSKNIQPVSNNNVIDPDLYKEKTKIRDIYNAYRLTLRDDARVESFIQTLKESIKNIKPYDINPIKHENSDTYSEAILMFSDLHIGVNCSNFYNKFNSEIAFERVKKLAEDTIKYCNAHNVRKLNVINLGDLIHGIIHTTARLEQEFDIIDQITKAAELLSYLLARLANSGFHVTYRSCTDNHSRALADKTLNIEKENFARLIDIYAQIRLENSNVSFINDNIDSSIGKFTLTNGKKVMFAHGHLENPNKCVDSFIGATKEFIDFVLLSHYHTGREKSYNGSKLIINGSIVGTEDYALSKRLFSPAEQKLLIFDKDNFIDLSINLQN